MTEQAERRDPAWDPLVRWRAQRALDDVVRCAKDIIMRYSATDRGYVAPNEVDETGDVTGLVRSGVLQVIRPLQAELDKAREVLRGVYDEVDAYHAHPNYTPPRRPL